MEFKFLFSSLCALILLSNYLIEFSNKFPSFIIAALTSRKLCSEMWLCICSSSVHLNSQTEQSNSHCTNLNCSFFWYKCLYELIISRGVLLDSLDSMRCMVMMFSRFLVTGSTRRNWCLSDSARMIVEDSADEAVGIELF